MILVAGATGKVGGEVVEALKAIPGAPPFQALVRRPEAAAELEARGVRAVLADLGDPARMAKALEGVERFFLVSAPDPRQVEIEGAAAEAARAAGVRQIVKLSALGADAGAECAFLRFNRAAEERVAASGVAAWTFLRPNGFFHNLLGYADSIRTQGAFYAPAGEARISLVDTADIGAVAARVLTDPIEAHAGQTYDITGPEALTHDDIARALSALLGRDVRYVAVDDAAAKQGMLAAGMPEWQAEAVVALYRFYRTGAAATVTDTVPALAGRPARTAAQFLEANRAVFS